MTLDRFQHQFCGYCGKVMKEVSEHSSRFDRKTGAEQVTSHVRWECPKWKVWQSDAWSDPNKHMIDVENPHDSIFVETREHAATAR